jgi:hypothetical protein
MPDDLPWETERTAERSGLFTPIGGVHSGAPGFVVGPWALRRAPKRRRSSATDHKPGASLNLDLVDHQAPGQWTEHEIHGFIASRHKQRVKSEGERPEEPLLYREHEAPQRPCIRRKCRPAARVSRGSGGAFDGRHVIPSQLSRGGGQEVRIRDHGRSGIDHRIASCVLPFADLPDFVT